jgi:hypothetical protein
MEATVVAIVAVRVLVMLGALVVLTAVWSRKYHQSRQLRRR